MTNMPMVPHIKNDTHAYDAQINNATNAYDVPR